MQGVVRGEDVRGSGVHYLEYESLEIDVRGKVWKVFGSPVSSIVSGVSHTDSPICLSGRRTVFVWCVPVQG